MNFMARVRKDARMVEGWIMESYVVRIYRRDDEDPAIMNGIVETVGIEGEKSFGNIEDLWELLGAGRRRKSSGRVKEVAVK